MKKVLLLLVLTLGSSLSVFGQGGTGGGGASGGVPITTVAGLSQYTSVKGQLAVVTNGSTASDCTTGGGSFVVVCQSSGSSWSAVASSGSAGAFSGLTSGTNTGAAMLVGTGATLGPTGSGTLTANAYSGTVGATNGGTGSSSAPSSGQIPVGNSGGTAYAPQGISGDCTMTNTGAITCTKSSGTAFGTFAFQNYATPPAIGGTTPAAGSFTTLSASSTVSGSGFSTYLASPPAIGGTSPASGKFTTLTANTSFTLNGGTAQTATQGSDTSLLTSGTVSGTGSTLCTDSNGGATTSGCTTGTISSVSNSDGTLTISPTTGAVVASLNLTHAFTFTGQLTFNTDLPIFGASTAHSIPILEGSSATGQLTSPSTNGLCLVGFNVTGSAGVDPTCALAGVGYNPQTTTYTIAYSDRAGLVPFTGSSATTFTIPADTTAGFGSNFPFATPNFGTATLTLDSTTQTIDGGSSQTVLQNWVSFNYSDSSGNFHTVRMPMFAAFGSTCSNGLTWSTSSNFGCLSAAPILSGGTAGGDLSGTYPNPTVAQIEGAAIPASANLVGTNSSKQLVSATATNVSNVLYVAGGGTAQAQTATLSPAVASLTNGLIVNWLPLHANTGAGPTLAVNGLSAVTIVKTGGASLAANDLTTTAIASAWYDGTDFELQNPQTSGSSSGTVNNCSVADSTGIYTSSGTTISCTSQAGIEQYEYAAGGGTAQAQTVTLAPALGAWATGVKFSWLPSNSNTTAGPTINPNSLGGKTITKCGESALVAGDLTTTAIATVIYDGTDAELQNPQAVSCASQQYSNLTGQTGSISSTTLASSPTSGQYRINYYSDFNSGTGTVYFTFNWTDGSTSRSLTTGIMTSSNGYMSGLMPIFVGSGNVTYSSTASGTVNYDAHVSLERMQ